MAKKSSSRPKGERLTVMRQRRTVADSICGWCQKVIADDDAWPGDVEVATWLCAPIRKGSRVLCRRCCDRLPAMIEPAIRKYNRLQPELRLQIVATDSLSLSQLLPNLKICIDFFYQEVRRFLWALGPRSMCPSVDGPADVKSIMLLPVPGNLTKDKERRGWQAAYHRAISSA